MMDGHEQTILVVDTDSGSRKKIGELLKKNNFNIISCADGDEALRICSETDSIVLVLIEVSLKKDTDGIDAARRILSMEKFPVIFFTDTSDPDSIKKAYLLDHEGYLPKNSEKQLILSTIVKSIARFQTRRNFQLLAANSRDMIYSMSLPDGKYEYVSPAAKEITGYDPEEFYANPMLIASSFEPEWLEWFEEQWNKLLKGEVPDTYEYPITTKDGERRWLNQRNVLIKDERGRPKTIQGVVTDITERKEIEEQLKASEKRFRYYVENSPLGVFVADEKMDYKYVNAAACGLTGYSEEELLQMNVADFVTPEWNYDPITGLLSGNTPFYRKDGTKRFWSVNATKLNEDRIICFAEDITENVKNEQALAELARQNEQLFMEINHRVKNNLANIEALARLELSYEEKGKEEAIKDLIERIRAIRLIHQLLSAGDSAVKIDADTYLSGLTEKVAESYSREDENYSLHFDIEPVKFSSKMTTTIGIITTELLTNTFKYADFSEGCSISIALKRKGEHYVFIYRDSGSPTLHGITEIGDLKSGMGTLLIRELVKGLRGDVQLDVSEETVFTIRFPVTPAAKAK